MDKYDEDCSPNTEGKRQLGEGTPGTLKKRRRGFSLHSWLSTYRTKILNLAQFFPSVLQTAILPTTKLSNTMLFIQ